MWSDTIQRLLARLRALDHAADHATFCDPLLGARLRQEARQLAARVEVLKRAQVGHDMTAHDAGFDA